MREPVSASGARRAAGCAPRLPQQNRQSSRGNTTGSAQKRQRAGACGIRLQRCSRRPGRVRRAQRSSGNCLRAPFCAGAPPRPHALRGAVTTETKKRRPRRKRTVDAHKRHLVALVLRDAADGVCCAAPPSARAAADAVCACARAPPQARLRAGVPPLPSVRPAPAPVQEPWRSPFLQAHSRPHAPKTRRVFWGVGFCRSRSRGRPLPRCRAIIKKTRRRPRAPPPPPPLRTAAQPPTRRAVNARAAGAWRASFALRRRLWTG
jgi:hypothetical protein